MAAMPKSVPVTPAVRIPSATHLKLQEISRQDGRTMGEIVTELVEKYEKERFWDEVEASVARLKADPVAWQDYQDEIALLEGGSMDGLEAEPAYFTAEELEEIRARNPRPAIG
jgi:predicted DNA-binding protein